MRLSSTANRSSHAGSASTTNVAAAAAKLLEKKKEFDAVSALDRASALYLKRIESLCHDCDIMADAGQAHGQVLEQWPRMFEILSLFLASREKDDVTLPSTEEGQRLARIPIDELQQSTPSEK